jgi:hypothetical protein
MLSHDLSFIDRRSQDTRQYPIVFIVALGLPPPDLPASDDRLPIPSPAGSVRGPHPRRPAQGGGPAQEPPRAARPQAEVLSTVRARTRLEIFNADCGGRTSCPLEDAKGFA